MMAKRHTLVTGGAGFIGTNLAARLLEEDRRVLVLDNLARPGVERNQRWLQAVHGDRVEIVHGDVRDADLVRAVVQDAEAVFHLAAQVAVTTSLADPLDDFTTNLHGTVTLLEELRRLRRRVPLLFTSTNKVYGSLPDVQLERVEDRWLPVDPLLRDHGVDESRPLDFCTPYGCSKGGADQYVLDYAKTFGLPAVVFRMSCIYGPHQHGNEDQGWVAHFLIHALAGEPITIYGDGRQVRDILFATDLVDAMFRVVADIDRHAGTAFNLGGGPARTISLLELLDLIEKLGCGRLDVRCAPQRAGDQRWYVANTARLHNATGWRPTTDIETGIGELHRWLASARTRPLAATEAA
jgi:CDP-paratose 2-epimerase